MRSAAFVAVGLLLLIVQSNFFRLLDPLHLEHFSPSLVLPLILFLGVHEHSLGRGAAISFALGYITDVVGIAPVGLNTFASVAIFLLARVVGVRLAAQTVSTQLLLCLIFAISNSVIVLVLIAIFGRDAYMARSLYLLVIPHVVATTLAAPLVFRLAERIGEATGAARPDLRGGRS